MSGLALYAIEWRDAVAPPIMNHVPDGLWAYALMSTMASLWHRPLPISVSGALLFAYSLEFAQLGPLPGTFDPIDLVFYALGVALAVLAAGRRGFSLPRWLLVGLPRASASFAVLVGFGTMFLASVAPVNSTYDSARMLAPGEVELAGSYAKYGTTDSAWVTNNNWGGRVGFGITDRLNLKIRYERLLSTIDPDILVQDYWLDPRVSPHAHYIETSAKLSLGRGRTALSIPLAFYIFDLWGQAHISPRIIHTWNHLDVLELSVSGVVDFPLAMAPPYIGGNVGLGVSTDLDVWALRPEVGMMIYPWFESNAIWTFGVGLGVKLPSLR